MRAFLLVFAPLLLAYLTALQWCVDRWNAPTQYYEHCWLVPAIGAFVVWRRRPVWSKSVASVDRRGLWLLAPALCMHFVGAALMIDSLSATSLALAVPGAAWFALGRARLAGLWPVLWLSLFLVPAPIVVEGWTAFVLKDFAVGGGAGLAGLLGADLERRGSELVLRGGGSLYVADACGGLRSLLAMVTISYCLAFFVGAASWRRRAGLLALALPVAVGANIVRIAGLCLMAQWFGVPFAEGTGHTIANVVEWAAAVAALVAIDALLSRGAPPPPRPVSGAVAPAAGPRAPSLARAGAVLWLLAVPLLWLSLYRPGGSDAHRAERVPDVVGGYAVVPRTPAEEADFQRHLPRWRELLGTADFAWRRYRDEQGARINLVATFHDTNWKSVHAPRICIEGSNMDIELDDLRPLEGVAGGSSVSRIVARSRDDGWRYLTLSLFGTRSWASGSYSEFALHHMPLALLRNNESGFLLRVETPVARGEDLAAAERRCAEFLRELVPACRELLR